jgi:DNA-binding CsgD family transcriptional regulator
MVSRRIRTDFRRRVFIWVLVGSAAVAALLRVPSLSMKGTESTTYGKPWSVEPAVAENITVWVVLSIGLAAAAWALGRPRARSVDAATAGDPEVPASSNDAFSALTPREQETFMLVAGGHSNAEIAERLFITEATVKTYVGSLLAKLGLTSRSGLIAYAYDQRIVLPTYPASPDRSQTKASA